MGATNRRASLARRGRRGLAWTLVAQDEDAPLVLVHERHVLVGESGHGATDADSADVGADYAPVVVAGW